MAAVLFSALLAGAQKQWHWKCIRSRTEQNHKWFLIISFPTVQSFISANENVIMMATVIKIQSISYWNQLSQKDLPIASYLWAWVLCAHLSLVLEQVGLVWDTWELQGKVNFIQNSLHMIFKPPLYLSCSCTSQIHASSSFNHTHTCLCLFIKCWLHGLGRAKQLRLATFQTHTCIWGVSVLFQVLGTDCSISNSGGEGAGSRPPHIGIYLKLHTCLCSVTGWQSWGPLTLLCSMDTPFAATWACHNPCGVRLDGVQSVLPEVARNITKESCDLKHYLSNPN